MDSTTDFIPSADDIKNYTALKGALVEIIRKEGSQFLLEKSTSGFVGLTNQGATCYLNSLLQSLYNLIKFRDAIFNQNADSPVVKEMQRLFSSLSLSNASAVSTKGLTTVFGWSNSELFEQHDIQELFNLLLNTLAELSDDLGQNLNRIFRGQIKDILECPLCGNLTESISTFIDIPVNLLESPELDNDNNITHRFPGCMTLSYLLKCFLKPETLDADNLWECNKCAKKVQAVKTLHYESLPEVIMLHLKRFRYDPITRRRIKLSHPVLFSEFLDGSELQVGCKDKYRLSSVLLHTGTATGGHYRAYVIDGKRRWFDFNDAVVTTLVEADKSSLFWFDEEAAKVSSSPDSVASVAGTGTPRSDIVYENAYMLVYERVDAETQSSVDKTASVISKDLQDEVDEANKQLLNLREAYRVHQQMVELSVYHVSSGSLSARNEPEKKLARDKVTLNVLKNLSLDEVLRLAHEAIVAAGFISPSHVPINLCRVRRFNPVADRLGETFGGRETESLAALGLHPVVTLAVESRTPADPEFIEFNPKEMALRVLVWKAGNRSGYSEPGTKPGHQGSAIVSVVVPGEESATVQSLRAVAAAALQVPPDRLVLLRADAHIVVELDEDTKLLRRDCNIWPGEEVVAEILAEGSARGTHKSEALVALRSGQRNIKIFYNNPSVPFASVLDADEESVTSAASPSVSSHSRYPQLLETSLDATLAEVKAVVASAMGIDKAAFHVKHNHHSPQLKDESKSLDELGFAENSIMHLESGPGCSLGEHMLRFELDTMSAEATISVTEQPNLVSLFSAGAADFITLGELPVREKATVGQLKEQLLAHWSALVGSRVEIPVPKDVHHIKVRDGKGQLQSSIPLRDDRLLSRCLLGVCDGRRIVIQVLSKPEQINPTDILLAIRIASYGTTEGMARGLSRSIDLPFPRTNTVKQLLLAIVTHYPFLCEAPGLKLLLEASGGEEDANKVATEDGELQEICRKIGFAKAYSTGPPLNLREISKLKWNDPQVLSDATVAIDKPPLNLRDGSVIVIRSQADFFRAKVAAKHKREAEEASGGGGDAAARPTSRAAGRPKSRSSMGRPKSKAVASRNRMSLEKPLQMKLQISGSGSQKEDQDAPPPPSPSPVPAPSASSGGLPSAPVRVIKMLREGDAEDANGAES